MDLSKLPTVFVVKMVWVEKEWHMYGHKDGKWFFIFDFTDVAQVYDFFERISKKSQNYYDICIYKEGHNFKDNFVRIIWSVEKDKWVMHKYIGNHWAYTYEFFNCENFNHYFKNISQEKENFYNIRIKKIEKE